MIVYINQDEDALFQISVAESLLNDFSREENIFKAVNIFTKVLNIMQVEDNSKNILSIILSKLVDVYMKSNNRLKLILNRFIDLHQNKLSEIFINKDIASKIVMLLTCSDWLTRTYTLALILYLPNILHSRLDIIHILYESLLNEKVPHEEKMLVICIFTEKRLKKNEEVEKIILQNFESIMKGLNCHGYISSSSNSRQSYRFGCKKCFAIKSKFLVYIYDNMLSQHSRSEDLIEKIEKYFKENRKFEFFQISAYLMCILVDKGGNRFLDKENPNNLFNDEGSFIFLNKNNNRFVGNNHNFNFYPEFEDIIKNDFIIFKSFINNYHGVYKNSYFTYDLINFCISLCNNHQNLTRCFNKSKSKSKSKYILDYLIFLYGDNNSIYYDKNFKSSLNLISLIKLLYLSLELEKFNISSNKTNILVINERNLESLLENSLLDNLNHCDLTIKNLFKNSHNIQYLIGILKHFYINQKYFKSLKFFLDILVKNLELIIKSMKIKEDFIFYWYFLDQLFSGLVLNTSNSINRNDYSDIEMSSNIFLSNSNSKLNSLFTNFESQFCTLKVKLVGIINFFFLPESQYLNLMKLSLKHKIIILNLIKMDFLNSKESFPDLYKLFKCYIKRGCIDSAQDLYTKSIRPILNNHTLLSYFENAIILTKNCCLNNKINDFSIKAKEQFNLQRSITSTNKFFKNIRTSCNMESLLNKLTSLEEEIKRLPKMDILVHSTGINNNNKISTKHDKDINYIREKLNEINFNSENALFLAKENLVDVFFNLKCKVTSSKSLINNYDWIVSRINQMIFSFSKYFLIILPEVIYSVKTSCDKTNTPNVFLIKNTIEICNLDCYLKNMFIVITISLDLKKIRTIKHKVTDKNINTGMITWKYKVKEPRVNSVLNVTISFIHQDVFFCQFYEHSENLLFD